MVQLNERTRNPMLRYGFVTVTDPKSRGAQAFVQRPGADGEPGGQAYDRARFGEMAFIGRAVLVPGIEP